MSKSVIFAFISIGSTFLFLYFVGYIFFFIRINNPYNNIWGIYPPEIFQFDSIYQKEIYYSELNKLTGGYKIIKLPSAGDYYIESAMDHKNIYFLNETNNIVQISRVKNLSNQLECNKPIFSGDTRAIGYCKIRN